MTNTEKQAIAVRVAAIQMASSPHVSSNLVEAERLIDIASLQGAKIVVLPEYFCIMGAKEIDKVNVREREGDGQIQRFLSKMARSQKNTMPPANRTPTAS